MLKVGDRAPEFSLTTDGGKLFQLKELHGRQVVLFFFPRASTPG